MNFSCRVEGDVCVISLQVDFFDKDEAAKSIQYITPLIENSSIRCFLMNLQEVSVMDSSLIEMILSIQRKLKERRMEFSICQKGKLNRETLNKLNPNENLRIFQTEEKALAFLQA